MGFLFIFSTRTVGPSRLIVDDNNNSNDLLINDINEEYSSSPSLFEHEDGTPRIFFFNTTGTLTTAQVRISFRSYQL